MERMNIFLCVEIFFLVIVLYFHGISQNIEYFSYKLNKNNFKIIEASVVNVGKEIYGAEKKPNFTYDTQQIVYYIDGNVYCSEVYSYQDKLKGDNIFVAIKNDNPYLVKRCIPYKLTKKDIKTLIIYSSVILVLVIFQKLYLVFYKKRDIKDNKSYIEKDNINNKKSKQEELLSIIDGWDKNIIPIEEINIAEHILMVKFESDFIWCIANLGGLDTIKKILFFKQNTAGQYEFVTQTLSLREKGLPPNYYVVANEQQHFLCGREDSSRLYLFSYSLGITNTKYANIFDYILERLNEKR